MEDVAVILATYNGEKYIREQLNSLINQTYGKIRVYIHDDGSSDSTVDIIKEYLLLNIPNCSFQLVDQCSLGYPQCFIHTLVTIPKASYYAFCDQDDVWNDTKIEDAVEAIKRYGNDECATLYYAAVDYYDGELKYIRGARFANKKKSVVSEYSLQELLFGGEAMGMTFVFNNKVRDVFAEIIMNGATDFKDTFIKIYCAACGKVIYSFKPCAKYRRHSEATTVGMNPAGKFRRLTNMIIKIFIDKDGMKSIQSSVNYINLRMNGRVLPHNKVLIDTFSQPNSFSKRIRKTFWPGRFRLKLIDEIGYRFAFLIGRI